MNQNDDLITSSLAQNGWSGGVEALKADLISHSELITEKPILGGTMHFGDESMIDVLSDRYVFAYFEDGHILGYALLDYKIEDGKVTWNMIDSYIVE